MPCIDNFLDELNKKAVDIGQVWLPSEDLTHKALREDVARFYLPESEMPNRYQWLYGLAVASSSKNILELGVHTGLSTIALFSAARSNSGSLLSVDVQDVTKYLPDVIKVSQQFKFIMSNTTYPKTYADIKPESIDFVFVDTEHTDAHVMAEWRLIKPLLKDGALVVMDEFMSYPDFYSRVNQPSISNFGMLAFIYKKDAPPIRGEDSAWLSYKCVHLLHGEASDKYAPKNEII